MLVSKGIQFLFYIINTPAYCLCYFPYCCSMFVSISVVKTPYIPQTFMWFIYIKVIVSCRDQYALVLGVDMVHYWRGSQYVGGNDLLHKTLSFRKYVVVGHVCACSIIAARLSSSLWAAIKASFPCRTSPVDKQAQRGRRKKYIYANKIKCGYHVRDNR